MKTKKKKKTKNRKNLTKQSNLPRQVNNEKESTKCTVFRIDIQSSRPGYYVHNGTFYLRLCMFTYF